MEEYTPEVQEESTTEDLKRWFQDNLRIVISIAIVVVIAGGIYSYSKRGETPLVTEQSTENAIDKESTSTEEEKPSDAVVKETAPASSTQEVSSTATSKETESSFIETAEKNSNLTVLARKATANYLEKNQDSSLTKEHKIYIEDYLRKNVDAKGGVKIGTSVEFSKDLIQKAIAQSKTLNEKQLKNLEKYSARVSSL
ncbi:MAG: hypothetical protein US82_C0013G0001 [Parcubacteria group bacterium GW2011_GWC1_38_22]|nr:MAG: hypothetical protein US82_C0013G0001 [Parcubacteria group bacterium GW2011_GWC1_38_22]